MPDFLDRTTLLACLTDTHERTVTPDLFGNRPILIREITGRQRQMAIQAAQTDDPENPDDALYRAMLIQMAVVDPTSGTPGPDGRIDPRTRIPLLTIADVESIANGRDLAARALSNDIAALAGLPPAALFRGDSHPDRAQRDPDEGDADRSIADHETETARSSGADE